MNNEVDTLSSITDGEEEMGVIPCADCGLTHTLHNRYEWTTIEGIPHHNDIIRGTVKCGKCFYETVFVRKTNDVTFLPGKLLRQDLGKDIHPNALLMIHEALKCFYGASYVGAVGMCKALRENVSS